MEYNNAMMIPAWLMYMQAGAYAAIMIAVIGVPQLLSSYFDHRTRRREQQEAESNAERRHRELMEERREERRREDERWRLEEERRRQEEERRRQEEERRRQELDFQRQEAEQRRQEFELHRQEAERRHEALLALLINGAGRRGEPADGETIRTMQETIDALEAENARLRERNGHNGGDSSAVE